jgi:ubiquinone/menaquinone biosynthesis C-methylase UbiE
MTDQKEAYYSDAEVVREYERRRFARGGGRYVADKEETTIREIIAQMRLPAGASALDCPTGTGRFLPLLQTLGLAPTAVDISPAMLELAGRVPGVKTLRASADALPLEPDSVQLWLMSRFAFHFADLRPFLREAARVLAPGGYLVFDIYHWTPRSWIPGDQKFLGGRVHTHPLATARRWLEEAGLRVTQQRPVFLLAPYLYGFMPAPLPPLLDRLSDIIAPNWKTKSYLVAQKAA